MNRLQITVAIPAYNEVESLGWVVERARDVLLRTKEAFEVLIVDDGSTDGTGALADRLASEFPQVRVVRHASNRGFTGAIATAYGHAQGDWLFLCPADGQVDVADIERFLPHRVAADVVLGYRTRNPEPWIRRLNSFGFHLLVRVLFGLRFREISSCKLYRMELLRQIPLRSRPHSATIEPEVIYRLARRGARFAEVGYPFHRRRGGRPKGARWGMILRTFAGLLALRLTLLREAH